MFDLQRKIWQLQTELSQLERRTTEVLMWQFGGHILLSAYLNGDLKSGITIAFWIRVAGFLTMLLAVLIWVSSSHKEILRRPTHPEQLKQLEVQAVFLEVISGLQQQIRYWRMRKFWILKLGWIGLLLHFIGTIVNLQKI